MRDDVTISPKGGVISLVSDFNVVSVLPFLLLNFISKILHYVVTLLLLFLTYP